MTAKPTTGTPKAAVEAPMVKAEKLILVSPGRPAYPTRAFQAFGVTAGDWRALVDAIYPSAKTTEAVELALAYCRARKLDPFKRPVHIVPVWDAKQNREVETVWAGIGELRTTASRTLSYAGCDAAVFGPDETVVFEGTVGKGEYARKEKKEITFPTSCSFTVYRLLDGQRVAFQGPAVRWIETYATMGKSDVPNEMWATRPYGQLEKCAEAAALRRAFPEELAGDLIADEIGRRPQFSAFATDLPSGAVASAKLDAFADPPIEIDMTPTEEPEVVTPTGKLDDIAGEPRRQREPGDD